MAVKAASKVALCKGNIKNEDGTISKCDTPMPSGLCRNRTDHLLPFSTGFCAVGAHEGISKKDHNGTYMRTCANWKTCPCDCHKAFDTMFHISQMPRMVVDSSHYLTPKNTYWIPTPEERAAMRAATEAKVTVEEVVIESPDPERIPVSFRKEFGPTSSGRSARGELESEVRRFCDEWLIEKYGDLCTPGWLSEKIGHSKGLAKGPSVGAIDAVFKRWEAIGFAVIERKPTRFVGYTPEGVSKGIEALRIQAKDKGRLDAGAASRTLGSSAR